MSKSVKMYWMGLDGDLEKYVYIFPQSVIAFQIKEMDNWFALVDQNVINMIPKKCSCIKYYSIISKESYMYKILNWYFYP